jgi:hypothetical protein
MVACGAQLSVPHDSLLPGVTTTPGLFPAAGVGGAPCHRLSVSAAAAGPAVEQRHQARVHSVGELGRCTSIVKSASCCSCYVSCRRSIRHQAQIWSACHACPRQT